MKLVLPSDLLTTELAEKDDDLGCRVVRERHVRDTNLNKFSQFSYFS